MTSETTPTEAAPPPAQGPSAPPEDGVFAALRDHLAPNESVLWQARPLVWSAVAGRHRELPWVAAGWVLLALCGVVCLIGYHWLLLTLAILMALGGAGGLAYLGYRRLLEARQTAYAVTDQRLITLRTAHDRLQLDARDLARCSNPRITVRSGGSGDIVVPANYGVIRAPIVLVAIESVVEVGHLITDARRRRQHGQEGTDRIPVD